MKAEVIAFIFQCMSKVDHDKKNKTVGGLKAEQRAWDVSRNTSLVNHRQKRPALCWARAKCDKPAHHSAAYLSLLPHHALTVGQQTNRQLITFSSHCCS